jgi:hypothetical protein
VFNKVYSRVKNMLTFKGVKECDKLFPVKIKVLHIWGFNKKIVFWNRVL